MYLQTDLLKFVLLFNDLKVLAWLNEIDLKNTPSLNLQKHSRNNYTSVSFSRVMSVTELAIIGLAAICFSGKRTIREAIQRRRVINPD
jgi:hypothetical protein